MKVTVRSQSLAKADADLLALPFHQLDPAHWRLPARYGAVDRALGGRIAGVIGSRDFRGKRGDAVLLYAGGDLPTPRVLLLGLGPETECDAESLRRAAGECARAAVARRASRIAIAAPASRRLRAAATAQALVEGALLGGYRFDRYKQPEDDGPGRIRSLALLFDRGGDLRSGRQGARTGEILAESQNLARRLSDEPANVLPPAALAREAQRVAREVGLRARVLGPAELRKRRMQALLTVGRGSANAPRLIVLEHRPRGRGRGGRASRAPTLCLVGKGITFDSGGISIKPGPGMEEMKHDMSGAAAVLGALRAAALLNLPLHVAGVIGAAENLPSGSAYRPGDVLETMSGQTVEVLNTDAEGRLVLADALHYANAEFEPEAMLDFATLTGACVIALGHWCSGAFGNHAGLIEQVRRAGEASGERIWPMPLWDEHREHIKSDVADLKNVGGREGGSITAAAFLSRFVGETPWVHLDIAGTAWTQKVAPYQPKGATGVGVRLALAFLRDFRPPR